MSSLNRLSKCQPAPRWARFAVAALFAAAIAGCGGGSDGAPGAPGKDADPAVIADLTAQVTALSQQATPETCAKCHTGATPVALSGGAHQSEYDKAKDASKLTLTIDSVVTSGTTSTMTFTAMRGTAYLKAADISSADMKKKRFYASTYNSATRRFDSAFSYSATSAVDVGTNQISVTATSGVTFAPESSNAQVYAVLAETQLNTENTMYDDVVNAGKAYGDAGSYVSAANVAACESCHGKPFLKEGYRAAHVAGVSDFAACKNCHVDSQAGGHFEWQIVKDNPARMAEINALVAAAKASGDTAHDQISENLTADEKALYAYKKRLMNDVHMSHAMEFPYPQAMNSCVNCHEGKLDTIFADAQFNAETCVSCHSVGGIKAKMAAAGFTHTNQIANLTTSTCTTCHNGSDAPTSRTIHNGGYDPKIYTATGVRYSDTFLVNLDSTTVANNKLTIKFSATGAAGSLAASSITPTVLIGLYGYDTKDFIVAAHGSAADKQRNLEYVWGGTATNNATNRFTQVAKTTVSGTTTWELTADLSLWADKIAAGAIKRAEIAVLPELKDANGVVLGLNAPSKTFDLTKNAFVSYFTDIVKVFKTTDATTGAVSGCNSCHDQLATTFHSGIRGGNIKVCRICHEVSNPGAHLEMQSRSIDSYVHAIHSFQAFDINKVDFTDPVGAMEYNSHIGSSYPNFTLKNCESCHNKGTYDVPDQVKSMPGVLSGSATLMAGSTRNISGIPGYVTGPAVRACGSCHRSQKINADDAAGLAVLNAHFKQNGYMVETQTGLWDSIVAKMMAVFK